MLRERTKKRYKEKIAIYQHYIERSEINVDMAKFKKLLDHPEVKEMFQTYHAAYRQVKIFKQKGKITTGQLKNHIQLLKIFKSL